MADQSTGPEHVENRNPVVIRRPPVVLATTTAAQIRVDSLQVRGERCRFPTLCAGVEAKHAEVACAYGEETTSAAGS